MIDPSELPPHPVRVLLDANILFDLIARGHVILTVRRCSSKLHASSGIREFAWWCPLTWELVRIFRFGNAPSREKRTLAVVTSAQETGGGTGLKELRFCWVGQVNRRKRTVRAGDWEDSGEAAASIEVDDQRLGLADLLVRSKQDADLP